MNRQSTTRFRHFHKPAAFIVAVLFVSMALTGAAQAAGELDTPFGNAGKVITDFANKVDIAYDMVIQPDGKIVVVGVHGYINSNLNLYDTNFAVARYNSDGSPDSSFGTGGKVSTDFVNTDDAAYSVALQPDGKIVVAGISLRVFGYYPSANFATARYNSDGTLDATFGNGGKVVTDFSTTEDVAKAVIIQPDNKIVVGGYSNVLHPFGWDNDFALVRYNSDGTLDTTFDGDGKLTTDIVGPLAHSADDITALALSQDGKIVAGGSATGGGGYFAFARYNPDGSLDTTFDTDGKVFVEPFGANAGAKFRAMVTQPDGKFVVAGNTYTPTTAARLFGVARFNANGSIDTTFGNGGSTVTPINPNVWEEIATDVGLTAGGKIMVAGYTPVGTFMLARYLNNGSLDLAFGNRGKVFTYVSNSAAVAFAVAIQADDKILVAGHTNDIYPQYSDLALLRYKANPIVLPVRSDFDGDGKSDVAVFRPSDGTWYVLNSSNGAFRAQPFGTSGDIAAPGDFDGDRVTDFAVFRPSEGNWYILNSSDGSFRAEHFGTTGDVPVAADYDGDARTDIAVFRPSQGVWYIRRSSDNAFEVQTLGIETSTDKPIPGYYDDDEKADIAFWRESAGAWYILQSSNNTPISYAWGTSGDQPVAGDYDGDGRFDIAVFRQSNGTWYIRHSLNGERYDIVLGAAGDKPVPGDYNGDLRMDAALWRPSNGGWYSPGLSPVAFGKSGDTPVPAAY